MKIDNNKLDELLKELKNVRIDYDEYQEDKMLSYLFRLLPTLEKHYHLEISILPKLDKLNKLEWEEIRLKLFLEFENVEQFYLNEFVENDVIDKYIEKPIVDLLYNNTFGALHPKNLDRLVYLIQNKYIDVNLRITSKSSSNLKLQISV